MLDEAIASLEQAVDATPVGTPELLVSLTNLADALLFQHGLIPDDDRLAQGVDLLRRVVREGRSAAPDLGLFAARFWGASAAARGDWDEAAEAYRGGLDCLSVLYGRQGRRDQKEDWLRTAVGMAPARGLRPGPADDLQSAVVVAETGRAVLLSEALHSLAVQLEGLARAGHVELVDAYRRAADALDAARPVEERPEQAARPLAPDSSRVALQAAVDAAVKGIRGLPGYAGFQKPPDFADVAEAATAPIAYLIAAPHGGTGLIVRAGGSVDAVDLPQLKDSVLAEQVRHYLRAYDAQHDDPQGWHSALLSVTQWLWTNVMQPVVRALDGEVRAVLVPMGALGHLPLHVAWRPDPGAPGGRRYAVDDVLLTYSPNARALTHARQAAGVGPRDGILVVADPAPVRADPLPFALAEAEHARAAFADGEVLPGSAARRSAVWAEMARWPVLHFACHAYANPADPLSSGLLLADDEEIRLDDLLHADRFHPRMVVLSACETAVVGDDLPDEAVSLPSGFLHAGARGVLASHWPVSDESTALLMQRFYELWPDDEAALDPPQAMRLAQQSLRQSTPDWDHPVFWGAFAYVGA
jgi:CHAT domain-containing protein